MRLRTLLAGAVGISWSASCASVAVDTVPAVFLPGLVSLPDRVEQGIAFSPDSRWLVFSAVVGRRDERNLWGLFVCEFDGVRWSAPARLPFSADTADYAPAFAPDGGTLYFSSRRGHEPTAPLRDDYDLWCVRCNQGMWGTPERLADGINTAGHEYAAAATVDHLFICAQRREPPARSDLYIVERRFAFDPFAPIRNFGAPVNSPMWEGQPAADLAGRRLWWNHVGEDEGASEDILFSTRTASGWGVPVRLGPAVNTAANEYANCFHRGVLYFARGGDIWSVQIDE